MTNTQINTRDIIETNISFPNSIYTGQRTYSSLFLIPAFDIDVSSDIYDFFVNAYIDDYQLKHVYKRPLFILLETRGLTTRFKKINEQLRKHKYFIYDYVAGSYQDKILYMYVFECPDEFKNDYDRFLKGEYSKFSDKYKTRFQKSYEDERGNFIESPLYGAIYKTPTFKRKVEKLLFDPSDGQKLDPQQEYFGSPERKIEVFRYE